MESNGEAPTLKLSIGTKSKLPIRREKASLVPMAAGQKHALEAIRVLSELMRGAKSESVRLNAAEAILSRGWGRPVQAFQVDGNFANRKLNELTNEELAAFEEATDLPRQASVIGGPRLQQDPEVSDEAFEARVMAIANQLKNENRTIS
jgi:hypothetical protein